MSGVPVSRKLSSCPSIGSVGVSGDGGEGNGNEGRATIPVLKMVEMIEQASQSDAHSSPPPIRRRITRATSESSFPCAKVEKRGSRELKIEQDDSNPAVVLEKSAPPVAMSSSSSGTAPRFQLDLSTVLDHNEKKKKRTLTRTTSMISLLTPKGSRRPQSARTMCQTNSFREALFSPRTVRSFVPPSLETLPTINFSEFQMIDKNKSKFEKSIRRRIEIDWKENDFKEITFKDIEQKVSQLCRGEIDRLFSHPDALLCSDLQITESPRARALVELVQKSGAIIFPIIQRLRIIRHSVFIEIDLKQSVTPNLKIFLEYLDRMIRQDHYTAADTELGLEKGKDLIRFMQTWDEFKQNKSMNSFIKYVEPAFGSKKARKDVFATLRKWCDPPADIIAILKKKVHKMDWDNISAMNVCYYEHEWEEDSETVASLSKITPSEIVRCLHTGVAIPPAQIMINDDIFYNEERDGGKDLPSEGAFLFNLLKEIHLAGLNPSISDGILQEYVSRINRWKKLSSEDQKAIPVDEQFPCLNVLRLMTNSAWGHADAYIRNLFPDLFDIPYITRPLQGLSYQVAVAGKDDFSVQLQRSYCVYPRIKPDDPHSFTPDKDRPLMSIDFSWTLSPHDGRWNGVLKVEGFKSIIKEHKWPLLHALIDFQDQENTTGKAPGTPRMRSNPRIAASKTNSSPLASSSAGSSSSAAAVSFSSFSGGDD